MVKPFVMCAFIITCIIACEIENCQSCPGLRQDKHHQGKRKALPLDLAPGKLAIPRIGMRRRFVYGRGNALRLPWPASRLRPGSGAMPCACPGPHHAYARALGQCLALALARITLTPGLWGNALRLPWPVGKWPESVQKYYVSLCFKVFQAFSCYNSQRCSFT